MVQHILLLSWTHLPPPVCKCPAQALTLPQVLGVEKARGIGDEGGVGRVVPDRHEDPACPPALKRLSLDLAK